MMGECAKKATELLRGSWWISLPWATFSIKEDERGVVIAAAPIAGNVSLGKRIEWVIGYYRSRGAEIHALWYEE